MSHFVCVVELPEGTTMETYNDALNTALAPFNEEIDVAPWREYEKGTPAENYRTRVLREKGLLPVDEEPTWARLAELWNELNGRGPGAVAVPGDDEIDQDRDHVDDDGLFNWSTYSPLARWDWWSVGGRWNGFFFAQPGVTSSAVVSWNEGKCNGGPIGLLDLKRAADEAEAELAVQFDAWHRLTAEFPAARSWTSFTAEVEAGTLAIDVAREEYWAQPLIHASRENEDVRWVQDPLSFFGAGWETRANDARVRANLGYSFLTRDGVWLEKGRMGWFGVSHDTTESVDDYLKVVSRYLGSLSPESFIVAVDCHI